MLKVVSFPIFLDPMTWLIRPIFLDPMIWLDLIDQLLHYVTQGGFFFKDILFLFYKFKS